MYHTLKNFFMFASRSDKSVLEEHSWLKLSKGSSQSGRRRKFKKAVLTIREKVLICNFIIALRHSQKLLQSKAYVEKGRGCYNFISLMFGKGRALPSFMSSPTAVLSESVNFLIQWIRDVPVTSN
jgi:hypothetical protein